MRGWNSPTAGELKKGSSPPSTIVSTFSCDSPRIESQSYSMASSEDHALALQTQYLNENPTSSPLELLPAAVGEKRPLPRGTASYPRKRAVTACQVCRARRTKCDNRKPTCSFCLKVGARCIQSPVDLSSFDPASLKLLERLDEVESAIGKCQSAVESIGSRFNNNTSSGTESSNFRRAGYPDIDRSRLLPASIKTICQWPAFETAGLGQPVGEFAASGLAWTSASPAEIDTSSTVSIDDLQPRFTKLLLDNFFQYIHVKNPVLDETRTRRMVFRLCMDGLDWSAEACLVLLVLALGATATPFEYPKSGIKDPETLPYARTFYNAAQKRLWASFSGSNRVLQGQCFFLSGVYATTMFQPETAWRFFLQALACCQGFQFLRNSNSSLESLHAQTLNLHESPSPDPSASSPSILTTEQTIYWSAWKSERELRGYYEMCDFPLSVVDLGIYPPFFPTPPVVAENDVSPGMGNDEMQYRERLSWYFYLSEISLRRLSFCISNGIVKFEPTGEDSFLDGLAKETPVYEAQAEEWAMRLPRIVSIAGPPDEDDICRFVLRGHLVNLYEIIYWPFIDAFINGVPADGADRPLLWSLVRKGLENHVARLWVNEPGYKHRHHGTLFLLHSCSRSALVLIAAAASLKHRLDQGIQPNLFMPARWHEAVRLAIEMNRYWVMESADSEYLLHILEKTYAHVQHLESL
ncbi:hypothetical protein EIK77_007206 [Talaromyces pinophilus]|nr:hypothetical protein EIK77_007206 [Talaromyces pinophilus]